MSRKAFILWGLAIISFFPIASAVIQYLCLSKFINIQDMNKASVYLAFAFLIGVPLTFGTILHLRFKEIGRRKRILALCMFLYILSFPVVSLITGLYHNYILMESDALTRFTAAIGNWALQNDPKPLSPWSLRHKIDYILIMLPMHFLGQLGLFALLAFGCLDPSNPSKNRIVKFFKTGFQRKPKAAQIEIANLVPA